MRFNSFQKIVAAIYFLVVVCITLIYGKRDLDDNYRRRANFDFFGQKWPYINNFNTIGYKRQEFIVLEIIGNTLLFVPFFTALYVLTNRRMGNVKAIAVLLLTILSVEGIQFVLNRGVFDIDDIILNFAGGLVGLTAFNFIYRKYILK